MKRIIKITSLITMLAVIPVQLHAREFLNTVVHLNFGGMYSFTNTGDFIDEENDAADTAFNTGSENSYYETAYTVTLDIVPFKPIILGLESNAIKLGIRGSYGFNFVQQRITADGSVYDDQLMNYSLWMIGPVIHFAPVIDPSDIDNEYTASSGFTFFATYGRLDGDLTAYAAIRDAGKPIPTTYSDAKVDGYKINVGFGAEIALCSLNFGMNIYYSYTSYNINRDVYPGAGKSLYMHEGCLELYVGFPIETFIQPLIPKF